MEHPGRTPRTRGLRAAALAAALGAGALMSIQARMNAALQQRWGNPIWAGTWAFGSGLMLLTAGLLVLPTARRHLTDLLVVMRRRELHWWEYLGGVLRGLYVAVQAFTVSHIGVSMFTVTVIGGQTVSALLVDRVGLSPAGRLRISGARVLSALLAISAALYPLFVEGPRATVSPWLVLLAVVSGGGQAFANAFNAQVSATSHSTLSTTWLSFVCGVAVLLVLLVPFSTGHHSVLTASGVRWWAWCGGVVGIGFIAATAWGVRHVGVLVFGVVTTAGQLVTALLLDATTSGQHLAWGHMVPSVLLVLVAASAAALVGEPPPPPETERASLPEAP